MSWMKPAGKRAMKYGPQAVLVWKHAGKPVSEAAQRAVATRAARHTALKHADTVIEGAILKVVDEGVTRWVVFSRGKPVAGYPPPTTSLAAIVADADLTKKMTPDQFRARQAERSRRRRAVDTVASVKEQLRRRGRGDSF